jgi:hypothetical protein
VVVDDEVVEGVDCCESAAVDDDDEADALGVESE